MPDDDDQTYDDPGHLRRMLEESGKRAAEAEAQLANLQRKDVFRDAGLDLSNKQHAAFMRAYDGTLDQTAVAAYVEDLGIGTSTPKDEPAPPTVPQSEQDQLVAIAEAARGGGNPPPNVDRREQIKKDMEVASRRGDHQTLDRLSREYSVAGGFEVADEFS